MGTNVLLADVGALWFTSPYSGLKDPQPQGFAESTLVVRATGQDAPSASAGVLYAQRVRPGGAAEWALAEPPLRALAMVEDAAGTLNPHYPLGEAVPRGHGAPAGSLIEGLVLNDALESSAGGKMLFWREVVGALPPSVKVDEWANQCATRVIRGMSAAGAVASFSQLCQL